MFKTIARMRDHQDARRCRVAAGEGKDGGFSLVELLVVVVIIAILSAIAIPIFLNQRNKAYKATAQADGRVVAVELTNAFNEYTTLGPTYTAPNPTITQASGSSNLVVGALTNASPVAAGPGTIAATRLSTGSSAAGWVAANAAGTATR